MYLHADTLDFAINVLQPEFWGMLNSIQLHSMVYTQSDKS